MATIINRFGTLLGATRIKLPFGNRIFEGIDEITYATAAEDEFVMGMSRYAIGFGEGPIPPVKGSFTLLQEEVIAIQQSLPPGKTHTDMSFYDQPVVMTLGDGTVYTEVLRNVKWLTVRDFTSKSGDKATWQKIEFTASHIAPNGVDPI